MFNKNNLNLINRNAYLVVGNSQKYILLFLNIAVHAAPEPCKELLDLMIKPGKIQKLKEDEKERDNKHKRKKENIRQLKKGNSYK